MAKLYNRNEFEKIKIFFKEKGLDLERATSLATWHIESNKGDLKYGSGMLSFSPTYGWRAFHRDYPQFQDYVNQALSDNQNLYGEGRTYEMFHKSI